MTVSTGMKNVKMHTRPFDLSQFNMIFFLFDDPTTQITTMIMMEGARRWGIKITNIYTQKH